MDGLHSRLYSLTQALGLDPVLLDNDLGGRTVVAENDDEKNDGVNELRMGPQGQQSSTATTATGTTEALPGLSSSSPPPPSSSSSSGAASTTDFDFDFFSTTLVRQQLAV
jgi:hypothetical protein